MYLFFCLCSSYWFDVGVAHLEKVDVKYFHAPIRILAMFESKSDDICVVLFMLQGHCQSKSFRSVNFTLNK